MSSEVKEKINADRVANKKLTDAIRLVQATAFDAEGGLDPELVGLLDAIKVVCNAAKHRLIQDAWYDEVNGEWLCSECNENLSVTFEDDGSILREDSDIFGECIVKYCSHCGQRLIFKK